MSTQDKITWVDPATGDPVDPELTPEEIAQRVEEEDFAVPDILHEIWRRMREHDIARTVARQMEASKPRNVGDPPDLEAGDGEPIIGRTNVLDYATQMKTSVDQLIQLAGLAINASPVFEERHPETDAAIRHAFSCVQDIVPTVASRPDDDEPERELPPGLTADPFPGQAPSAPPASFPSLGNGGRHNA